MCQLKQVMIKSFDSGLVKASLYVVHSSSGCSGSGGGRAGVCCASCKTRSFLWWWEREVRMWGALCWRLARNSVDAHTACQVFISR